MTSSQEFAQISLIKHKTISIISIYKKFTYSNNETWNWVISELLIIQWSNLIKDSDIMVLCVDFLQSFL
ncbi:hypothetical protein pb186bvf_006225 [Paramecium bursaria]